jgi:hypothetical protein
MAKRKTDELDFIEHLEDDVADFLEDFAKEIRDDDPKLNPTGIALLNEPMDKFFYSFLLLLIVFWMWKAVLNMMD